jgi:hypothetical protein
MTFDLANIVGLMGSGLMIGAFAYSNIARPMNYILFNGLNLVGALMLVASLTVYFNAASMVLETVWAAIALVGLIQSLRRRAK